MSRRCTGPARTPRPGRRREDLDALRGSDENGRVTDASRRSGPPRAAKRFEPIANALAGRRWFPPWAIVHHRGRRSGAEYATPVEIVPSREKDVVLVCLPWSANTNWARNVVSAGGATLTWRGREQQTVDPRIMTGPEASSLARGLFRPVVKRMPAAIVLRKV